MSRATVTKIDKERDEGIEELARIIDQLSTVGLHGLIGMAESLPFKYPRFPRKAEVIALAARLRGAA